MAINKRKSAVEAFIALPNAEKDKIAKEFDREFRIEETQPLTPEERRRWSQIVRRDRKTRAYTKSGGGARRVPVSIEPGLLRRADAFAKRKGVSRSQLVAHGLELALAEE
jgi:hypothetical protein